MDKHEFFLLRVTVDPFGENVYIVGDPDTKECIIVDPGAEAETILGEVQRHGLKVKLIMSTHGHMDHTGAVAAIKEATGAPYAIHPADIEALHRTASQSGFMVPDFRPPPDPDQELRGGDTIQVGRFSFLVLETPGHSPGSICLYGHGIAITGDTLFNGGIGRFDTPEGNGREILKSIFGKLLVLPDATAVYPGHGFESTIGMERRINPFLQPGAERYIG